MKPVEKVVERIIFFFALCLLFIGHLREQKLFLLLLLFSLFLLSLFLALLLLLLFVSAIFVVIVVTPFSYQQIITFDKEKEE